MNRAVIHAEQPVGPDDLPPAQRRDVAAPLRLLFISTARLGFKTSAAIFERTAAARPDIDAVHWYPALSRLETLLRAPTPLRASGWDFHDLRFLLATSRCVRRRLGREGHFPLERFDVVHVQTQQMAAFLPTLRPSARCRFVVHADATVPLYRRTFGQPRGPIGPLVGYERNVVNAADALACLSEWTIDSMAADHGVPRERMFLFRPCPAAGAVKAQPRVRGQKLRIVFVGNDWERKGGARLLSWHQARWTDRVELHVCSGAAPVDRAAESVVWHGPTPHERLIGELLPSMHAMVMPTVTDTFLIAAAEAQAAGLAVISSRLAGIPEVVRDGVSGLLRDRHDDAGFVDAVERLESEPGLLERLQAGAREHSARNLAAEAWNNHLFDQFHRLARGLQPEIAPACVDPETLGVARRSASTPQAAEPTIPR
jgi:glycosyltransferase involved in cell wall biosynthesis